MTSENRNGEAWNNNVERIPVSGPRDPEVTHSDESNVVQPSQPELNVRQTRSARSSHSLSSAGSGGTTRVSSTKRSASGIWGIMCAIAGSIAVATGVLSVMRAWNTRAVPQLPAYSAHDLIPVTCVLAALTLVLVIIARLRAARNRRKTRSTIWGILAIVLALMLSAGAYALQTIAPEGVAKPPVRDEAPISDTQAMQSGVEAVYGSCADGWQHIDASQFPGVSSIQYCLDTRTAYATFDNDTAYAALAPMIQSKAAELLSEHSGEAQGTQWATIAGKRWVVVGEKTKAKQLEKAWGGTITDISFHR